MLTERKNVAKNIFSILNHGDINKYTPNNFRKILKQKIT
jgi:hypothetical protein